MRIVAKLLGERRPRARDWNGVAEAVRAGAAFLAQGASYSYLRARSGMMGPRLFQDPAFGAALEVCKWEGFGAAAQDLTLMLEADARAHMGPDRRGVAAALSALYRDAVALEPLPPHRAARGWEDLATAFDARAVFAVAAPPKGAADLAATTARRLMDFAPVEDSIRDADYEMVANNVAFRFVDYRRRLRAEVDIVAAAALLETRAAAARDEGAA